MQFYQRALAKNWFGKFTCPIEKQETQE